MTDVLLHGGGTSVPGGVDRPPGVLLDRNVGTHAGLIAAGMRAWFVPFVTTPAVQRATRLLGLDREMTLLRDAVAARGLSRLEIAYVLGVDRRTLSGYCSGEFRPPTDRIDRMRVLARLVAGIDHERPGRARDILFARRGGVSLLERIAAERTSVLSSWRRYAEPEAIVTVEQLPQRTAPIWAAAARAFSEGRLTPFPRRPTVRAPAAYEMDLDEAAAFEEPPAGRGRTSYQ
jgi:transcriptional regulator with XRE-family HTH domain